LVIAIPIGGFVPEFTARAEPEPTATQPARSPDAPKIGAKRAWALKASAAAAAAVVLVINRSFEWKWRVAQAPGLAQRFKTKEDFSNPPRPYPIREFWRHSPARALAAEQTESD
jgi:hypothetical protein